MTDLERLARAVDPSWWDKTANGVGKAMLLTQVCAVLTELRDNPSGKTILAGGKLSQMKDPTVLKNLNAMAIFRAMIDAVLSE